MDLNLTFNNVTKQYDSIRPNYPSELFDEIFEYSKLNSNSKCLEIGIGTGQATAPFLNKNIDVTAIDIGDNLCHFVRKKFNQFQNFTVINDDFMNCSFQNNCFDLIYSATAFHWLPDDALIKCKSILKDDGVIALFWNHPYPNRITDESNIINRKIYSKYSPSDNVPEEFSQKDCDEKILKLKHYGFKDIECKLFHRVRTLSSSEYIMLLNTYSDHIALPPKVREEFDNDMKNALDEIGGVINIYDTIDLYLAKK
jgi:ubiquinone/menaquinone biosynthesis C-methylase UbiE